MVSMTLKQRLFLKFYTRSFNATEAAYAVYNVKSRQSAAVIGSNLLRNVKVQKEIQRALEANGLTIETVVENIKRIANTKTEGPISANTIIKANQILIDLKLQQ
jgi:phage terminase small subunit